MAEQTQITHSIQQINTLNLRLNDKRTPLNTTLKTIIDKNTVIKKENTDLKDTPEKQTTNKP